MASCKLCYKNAGPWLSVFYGLLHCAPDFYYTSNSVSAQLTRLCSVTMGITPSMCGVIGLQDKDVSVLLLAVPPEVWPSRSAPSGNWVYQHQYHHWVLALLFLLSLPCLQSLRRERNAQESTCFLLLDMEGFYIQPWLWIVGVLLI